MDYKDYLDRFVSDVQALTDVVTEKTKQKASEAKLHIDIKKAETDRDKAYRALGRIMYQIEMGTLRRDENIVKAACSQVTEQEEAIARMKKDLEARKKEEETGAPTVNAQESSDGSDDKDEDTEDADPDPGPEEKADGAEKKDGIPVLKFCPSCGTGNDPDAKFCKKCGREI